MKTATPRKGQQWLASTTNQTVLILDVFTHHKTGSRMVRYAKTIPSGMVKTVSWFTKNYQYFK